MPVSQRTHNSIVRDFISVLPQIGNKCSVTYLSIIPPTEAEAADFIGVFSRLMSPAENMPRISED